MANKGIFKDGLTELHERFQIRGFPIRGSISFIGRGLLVGGMLLMGRPAPAGAEGITPNSEDDPDIVLVDDASQDVSIGTLSFDNPNSTDLIAAPTSEEAPLKTPEVPYQEVIYERYGDPDTFSIDYSYRPTDFNVRFVPTSKDKETDFFAVYKNEVNNPKTKNGPTHLHFVDKEHPAMNGSIQGRKPNVFAGGMAGAISEIPLFNLITDSQTLPNGKTSTEVYINLIEPSFGPYYYIRYASSDNDLHYALGSFTTIGLKDSPGVRGAVNAGRYWTLEWWPVSSTAKDKIKMDDMPTIVKQLYPIN